MSSLKCNSDHVCFHNINFVSGFGFLQCTLGHLLCNWILVLISYWMVVKCCSTNINATEWRCFFFTRFRMVQYHCYCISAVDCLSSFCFPKNELFSVCISMLWFSSIVMKSDRLICNLIIVHQGMPVVLSDLIEMN